MMLSTTTDSEIWRAVQQAREDTAGDRTAAIVGGRPLPPAGIITVAEAEKLWQAVLATCEQLVPGQSGCMRTAGAYGADGRSCSAFLSRSNEDGTSTSWFVIAHHSPQNRPAARWSVQVHGPATDSHDAEWQRRLDGDRSRSLVCDHRWYTIGPGSSGGFGGARFRFRDLATGQVTESCDMWHGGVIPPAWRERIPDTHEMLEGFHPGFTA